METENQQSNNPKNLLSNKSKIFSVVIILIQTILVFIAGYFMAWENIHAEWEIFLVAPIGFIGLGFSFFGFIKGYSYLTESKKNFFPVLLIFFSIITFPFIGIKITASIWEPIVRMKNNEQIGNERSEFIKNQENQYKKLTVELADPQKVIVADNYHPSWNLDSSIPILMLENGNVISQKELSNVQQKEFVLWAKSNLVGKTITATLPPVLFTEYCGNYTVNNGGGIAGQIRKSYGLSEYTGGWCQIIPVDIQLNGESVSKKF